MFSTQTVTTANNLIVRVSMKKLHEVGFEFRPDFEEDGREYSEEAFNEFMSSCEVDVYCRRGKTSYVIIENGEEWGAMPGGDDKLVCADVAALINSGDAQILNND